MASSTPSSLALRRLVALMRKESVQIVRDPSSILIAVVLPLILLFLFGYGISLDATRVKIGLAMENNSAPANALASAFRISPYFDAVTALDRRELEDELIAGRLKGIVVIPENFGEAFARAPESAQIQVIADGSNPNTARFVANYARGVWANWQSQNRAEIGGPAPLIRTEARMWFNPELKSRYFLVPGSIAIVMTLIGTLLTALVVAREWERGTMEAMMATPVGIIQLLIGKLIPYYVLAMTSMSVCTAIAVLVFDVPFRGSIPALFLIATAFLFPALGQGILISAVTKNQFIASQVALISGFLPAMLLSGFIFEIASMPTAIQWISYLVPARYLIPCLQSVFLAGDIWPLFLPNIGVLVAIGCVMFTIAARNTKKRLD
jgi:ABC-2 type transport system permease protein